MLRLLLLRHAKAETNRPGSGDFDRALTETGREAAIRIGEAIRSRGYSPSLALCSPARRTRETLGLITLGLAVEPESHYLGDIYDGEPEDLLEVIQAYGASAPTLLLVGHNPGLQRLALMVGAPNEDESGRAIGEKFPTGALAVFDVPIEDWSALRRSSARLEAFIAPREL